MPDIITHKLPGRFARVAMATLAGVLAWRKGKGAAMNTKRTTAVVGSFVAVLLLASAVAAEPSGGGTPQKTLKGPVKVFILAGQSNMQGCSHVRTLDAIGAHPTHGFLLKKIKKDDGSFVVRDDVFISFRRSENDHRKGPLTVGFGSWPREWIGPELMFGIEMGDFYENPVLLIKTCWGGHSLYGNFRPPSAGKLAYGSDKPEDVGASYRKMVKEVRECLANIDTEFPSLKGLKTEICGFVWFHGWNDMCAGKQAIDEYDSNFVHLVQDLRAEFKVPGMPVAIGESGFDGEKANKDILALRAAQAKIAVAPELKGTLGYVRTAPFWYPELDELPRKLESEEKRVRSAVAAQVKEQMKGKPESSDPKKMEKLINDAVGKALKDDADYQKVRIEHDKHISNAGYHYQGSGRFFCMVGFSLAEAMKPLLKK